MTFFGSEVPGWMIFCLAIAFFLLLTSPGIRR
jgi:hypothetical protein